VFTDLKGVGDVAAIVAAIEDFGGPDPRSGEAGR